MSQIISNLEMCDASLVRQPAAAEVEPAGLNLVSITARQGWRLINVRELWRYRELLWFLAVRDVKVRYKQTLLGAAWAVLQPLLTMFVFTIIFGMLANVPSDGLPYAL